MPEFNRGHGQIDPAGMDATRATARLPGVTCQPWLVAARALALPWTLALPRSSGDGASRSAQERGSSG
jgi:hypothetical protein